MADFEYAFGERYRPLHCGRILGAEWGIEIDLPRLTAKRPHFRQFAPTQTPHRASFEFLPNA
jgi:hypothetical protein